LDCRIECGCSISAESLITAFARCWAAKSGALVRLCFWKTDWIVFWRFVGDLMCAGDDMILLVAFCDWLVRDLEAASTGLF